MYIFSLDYCHPTTDPRFLSVFQLRIETSIINRIIHINFIEINFIASLLHNLFVRIFIS